MLTEETKPGNITVVTGRTRCIERLATVPGTRAGRVVCPWDTMEGWPSSVGDGGCGASREATSGAGTDSCGRE